MVSPSESHQIGPALLACLRATLCRKVLDTSRQVKPADLGGRQRGPCVEWGMDEVGALETDAGCARNTNVPRRQEPVKMNDGPVVLCSLEWNRSTLPGRPMDKPGVRLPSEAWSFQPPRPDGTGTNVPAGSRGITLVRPGPRAGPGD